MAKLTRKHYKRKKIAFAAVILGGVALVSSGFAAWVLSANATEKATGGVTVGEVKDASLEMTITRQEYNFDTSKWDSKPDDLNGAKFCFEPKKDDTQGKTVDGQDQNRVFNDGQNYEQLEVRYVVVVSSTNEKAFKQLNVKMEETTTDKKIDTAINTKNWVTAPKCYAADGVTIASTDTTAGDEVNKVKTSSSTDTKGTKYTWTIIFSDSFGWGIAFNKLNPGNYFDEDPTGKTVTLKTKDEKEDQTGTSVESILKDMHNTLDKAEFKITFTAVAQ